MLPPKYTLFCSDAAADCIMDAVRRIYANDHFFTYNSMLKTCSATSDFHNTEDYDLLHSTK